jgi:hypothetical protein
LAAIRGPKGARGDKGARGERGYAGSGGAAGATGPKGDPGASPEPKSSIITRDGDGKILSVTLEGEPTWSLSRDVDGAVASIEDPETRVTVSRDGDGNVSGTVVEEL